MGNFTLIQKGFNTSGPTTTTLPPAYLMVHYNEKYKIQIIDFLLKNNIPYAEAAIMIYTLRHKDKNGLEDLLEARNLIDILIEKNYPTPS